MFKSLYNLSQLTWRPAPLNKEREQNQF